MNTLHTSRLHKGRIQLKYVKPLMSDIVDILESIRFSTVSVTV